MAEICLSELTTPALHWSEGAADGRRRAGGQVWLAEAWVPGEGARSRRPAGLIYRRPGARYHLLKPEYLVGRVRELQRAFRPRVVLVHVDVEDPVAALGDVTATALRSDCTLICAWSHEGAAQSLSRPLAPDII